MDDLDLIAPDVSKLIQLFSAQPDLRFPDLDAAVLHDALSTVRERHEALVRAEALVAAAKSALDDDQEQLLKKSHRAHAYLKVFAESDALLLEKVQALSLPKLRRTNRPEAPPVPVVVDGVEVPMPPPRKRGRPRKVQPAGDSLFAAQEQPAAL